MRIHCASPGCQVTRTRSPMSVSFLVMTLILMIFLAEDAKSQTCSRAWNNWCGRGEYYHQRTWLSDQCCDCQVRLTTTHLCISTRTSSGCKSPLPGQTGRYQNSSSHRSNTCPQCTAGQYQSSTGQVTCNNCPSGEYQDSSGEDGCKGCDPGKYQNLFGQSSCNQCEAGQYSTGRNSSCTDCPGKDTKNTVCIYIVSWIRIRFCFFRSR